MAVDMYNFESEMTEIRQVKFDENTAEIKTNIWHKTDFQATPVIRTMTTAQSHIWQC